MPLVNHGGNKWSWGPSGHIYSGPGAKKKAIKNGIAIESPEGFKKEMGTAIRHYDTETLRLAQGYLKDYEEVIGKLHCRADNSWKWLGSPEIFSSRQEALEHHFDLSTASDDFTPKKVVPVLEGRKITQKQKPASLNQDLIEDGDDEKVEYSEPEGYMFCGTVAYLSKNERDNISEENFAGPDRSYPIENQRHLDAASKLIGRAPKDEQPKIKQKAKEIAHRLGLTLPKTWEN